MRDALSNFGFMLQWIVASVFALFITIVSFGLILMLGSFLLMWMTHQQPENLSPQSALIFSIVLYSSMGLIFGLIYGNLQKGLLRQKTHEPWRGWVIASAIGGVLGVDLTIFLLAGQLIPYLQVLILPPPDELLWLGLQIATIPFAVLALAQCFVLWRHVHGAWTWILANLVSGLMLYGLLAAGAFTWATSPLWLIAIVFGLAAAPAIVTGFAMIWLIQFNWRSEY